jgi:sulfite reductase alpha subunit-like flavoprotein
MFALANSLSRFNSRNSIVNKAKCTKQVNNLFKRFSTSVSHRPKLKVLFGSQTGTAMGFAHQLVSEAEDHHFEAEVIDMSEFEGVKY